MTPQPCGTRSAYIRHLRHGEEPCQECRSASTDYNRQFVRAQSSAKYALARLHPDAYSRFRAAVKAEKPGISMASLQGAALKQLTYRFPDEYRALYLAAKDARP